jgi:YD repeat-containing protein
VVLEYDANERLAKRTYADATFEEVVYDANGDVQKTRDRAGSWATVAARDGTGAVAQITKDGGSRQVATALRAGGGFVTATTETVGSTTSAASITSDAGGAGDSKGTHQLIRWCVPFDALYSLAEQHWDTPPYISPLIFD